MPGYIRHLSGTHGDTSRPRVHVLGLGSIGTFAAHSLSEIPNPPSVTLLCHRPSLLDAYRDNGSQVSLETREGQRLDYKGHDLEVFRGGHWYSSAEAANDGSPETGTIKNLIVAVKATQTAAALEQLKHRLSPQSTILFLQNGCGMIDRVNAQLFPHPTERPKYIVGVISHGVTLRKSFDIIHTGFAATSLGLVPNPDVGQETLESNYLLGALPLISTVECHRLRLHRCLEKLAVNAFCNPLCALNDAENGFLFTIPETRRAILQEISNVVCSLPELQHVENLRDRFAVDRLEATVNAIIDKTFHTTCSMVWDMRAGRETEIEFINGYWVKRGKEVGVPTPINGELVAKVTTRNQS
ncbi:2-dehydropantoate 2-reductase family protein [Penicillium brevicompactum]|uniref:2-dehydropantoate 2-reductase n=1 Tax=Penicillium brevicompactum TaxID=5074 RepID=A0A9W9QPS7_PENBR|nr:2-dehydropantoate 2-reductase family protein [Penicillium brevicompactum]